MHQKCLIKFSCKRGENNIFYKKQSFIYAASYKNIYKKNLISKCVFEKFVLKFGAHIRCTKKCSITFFLKTRKRFLLHSLFTVGVHLSVIIKSLTFVICAVAETLFCTPFRSIYQHCSRLFSHHFN